MPEQAKAASAEDKVSINHMLVALISERLGYRLGLKAMRNRAARADVNAALKILDAVVPDVDPAPGDELPEEGSSVGPKAF